MYLFVAAAAVAALNISFFPAAAAPAVGNALLALQITSLTLPSFLPSFLPPFPSLPALFLRLKIWAGILSSGFLFVRAPAAAGGNEPLELVAGVACSNMGAPFI